MYSHKKKAFNALKGGALDGRRAPIIRNDRSTRITKPSAGPSALVQQINNDNKNNNNKIL